MRVSFRLDTTGKLLSIGGGWCGDDSRDERLVKLAVKVVRERLARSAIAAAQANRIATSTEVRREAARNHWTIKWLERAHREKPKFGAERLMQLARQMLAAARPELEEKKRAEITEHRASEYLKAIRKKSGDV